MANGEPYGLPGMMEQAFQQIGTSMMSDDFACKLLAYVYVMGGGNEAVTLHEGLNAGIQIAQQKLNLYGGHTPKPELMPLLRQRITELELQNDKCEWLNEIFERYNLKAK